MPAIKGDRPFVGMTNEARKSKATTRRNAILVYLRNLSERIPIRALAVEFGVSLRTVMYDLEFLFKNGHAEELRPKFLEASHIVVPSEEISKNLSCDEIATNSKTTVGNMREYFRGEHLRSGKIHYDNIACFARGRLSFVEYQVLNVLKRNPGTKPIELYKIYLKECYCPKSHQLFSTALYRLVSLRRAFAKPISPKRYIYFAYAFSLRSLECGWSSPTALSGGYHRAYSNITNYSSYIGKSAYKTVKFSNGSKNRLVQSKRFYAEFNKACECGGPIIAHHDSVRYCEVCGLVEPGDYVPGIENTSGTILNSHTRLGASMFGQGTNGSSSFDAY